MKEAILVTGLQVRKVRCEPIARYHQVMHAFGPLRTTDDQVLTPYEALQVREIIVPITQFCRPGRPDMYIAYSKEVEDLLGFPAEVILKENSKLRERVHYLTTLSAWQHIKAAWRLLRSGV